jgi:hypothetical protein
VPHTKSWGMVRWITAVLSAGLLVGAVVLTYDPFAPM